MTVQALIDELMKVKEKGALVLKYDEAGGSYNVVELTAYRPSDGDLNHTVDCAIDAPGVIFVEV